jgi:hypothetical protein
MTDSMRSLSFGQVADEYDRWRPGYIDAAVDWLAVLAGNKPAARCHESDSTAIPVVDRSLDTVLAADAWHWFRQICETAGTASMPIRSEASCVRWTPRPQV